MDMYFPGLSRPSNVDVPDLVATVLYNYSIVTGKNALAAFLDLANTEFDFVWENFTGRPLQVNLHIERDGDMVLVRTSSPSNLDDKTVVLVSYRIV